MRFIHMADIHLGAVPDKGKPWSAKRAEEIETTFYRLLQEAGHQGVDLALIAGDIFHRPPTKRELKELNYRLEAMAALRPDKKPRDGLRGCKEVTQREIGKTMGISRSYVSRIEKKALEKLRRRMADFGIMW